MIIYLSLFNCEFMCILCRKCCVHLVYGLGRREKIKRHREINNLNDKKLIKCREFEGERKTKEMDKTFK